MTTRRRSNRDRGKVNEFITSFQTNSRDSPQTIIIIFRSVLFILHPTGTKLTNDEHIGLIL